MVTIWYQGVYIKVPQYCRLMDLFYCHTIALLRSDRTMNIAWLGLPAVLMCCADVSTGCVLLCLLLCICSTLSRLPHYRVSVRVLMTHLHLLKSRWHFSHVFQTALTFEDRWGFCSIESHGHWVRRRASELMHIKRLFVKSETNKRVKADRLRSRLIQGKWWNSPSRQSRTERGTRWNFTHTSTDVNLDLSLWLSLHIKYRLVTCTSQQNVKHFTTFGAFYFYSLINVRVKDVFYYWLKNDFPVLEKLWKISEKHEKFHSLYNFFLFLCFALKYI